MRRISILMAASALIAVSCSQDKKPDAQKDAKPQPYEYIVAKAGAADNHTEYPARLEGVENVEIRPKIDGFIENLYVDEGQMVSRGQSMFRIRNPQY